MHVLSKKFKVATHCVQSLNLPGYEHWRHVSLHFSQVFDESSSKYPSGHRVMHIYWCKYVFW